MLGKKILVDARLIVKALEKRRGDQLQQIAVTILVLAQQHQMVITIGVAAAGQALLRDIHLASDHRMHALLFGLVVKLYRAKKIAVVRHGDGGHLLLHHQIHQLPDFASAVEQRVVGMTMQVNERPCGTHYDPCRGRVSSIVLLTSISREFSSFACNLISTRCSGMNSGNRSPHSISTTARRSRISSRPRVATCAAVSSRYKSM